MAHFVIQIMGEVGRLLDTKSIELPYRTVEEVLNSKEFNKLKKEIKHEQMAFRIKRVD